MGALRRLLGLSPPEEKVSEFYSALIAKDEPSVLSLLESDRRLADPDISDGGCTPLCMAVCWGCESIVKALLARRANVNRQNNDDYGGSPLHFSARDSKMDFMRLLLVKGAKVNARDKNGRTPLHYAVCGGAVDVFETLLRSGADPNLRESRYKSTPLHEAVEYREGNHDDEVRALAMATALVGHGADVNMRSMYGNTPLHCAAHFGRVSVVEFLLANGAKANATDEDGMVPADTALRNGHNAVAALLREHRETAKSAKAPLNQAEESSNAKIDAREVRDAAQAGDLTKARFLLKSRPELAHATFEHGKTPLHFAAENGRIEIVELLLEKGAPVNAEDAVGQTPTLYAEGTGHSGIEKLLRKHGGYARTSERGH